MTGSKSGGRRGGGEVRTIQGLVIAAAWTDDDTLCEVSLLAEDEEYPIEPRGVGADLFDHLDDEVRVHGRVVVNEQGIRELRVSRFEVLDWDTLDRDEDSTW